MFLGYSIASVEEVKEDFGAISSNDAGMTNFIKEFAWNKRVTCNDMELEFRKSDGNSFKMNMNEICEIIETFK